MALKKSVEELKKSRDGIRKDVEDTRDTLKQLRPRPLRNVLEKRMTEVRPLKRMRKALGRRYPPDQPAQTQTVGSDNSGEDSS